MGMRTRAPRGRHNAANNHLRGRSQGTLRRKSLLQSVRKGSVGPVKVAVKTSIEIELPTLKEGVAMLRTIVSFVKFIKNTIIGLAVSVAVLAALVVILIIQLLVRI